MKPRFSKQRNRALTFIDVFVVFALLFVLLLAMFLPMLSAAQRREGRINCVSNLKQVNLALRIWAGDHNNQYQMFNFATNEDVLPRPVSTNAADYFQIRSNEFVTPKVLICPLDVGHFPATNFQNDFNNSHISYFLNPDASETYPQMIMSGDDNLAVNGVPVQPGLLELSSGAIISWTSARHDRLGNLGFADGSVSEESSQGFQNAFVLSTNGTPFPASRLVIP
jgi:prepilin-type processing-associated H-X9-DG protein